MKYGTPYVLRLLLLSFVFCLSSNSIFSQSAEESSNAVFQDWRFKYGEKGFEFRSGDNNYLLQVQSRLQFRFATPSDNDPYTFNDLNDNSNNVFKVNRSRLKVGGHAYKPWLKYYWEYDLGQSNLLDYRIMIERWDWLNIKVGQWKLEFSRERRISSGAQQTVDRSILNRAFTVDRQQGIELYGRLRTKGSLDFNYWVGVFTGNGRGARENDDKSLMYFGRLQWNMFGENIGFKSSDLSIHQKPAAIIALAGVTNRSPYTRFSSSGGGFLEEFEEQNPGQYRIHQANLETALVYKGFSWQSEFHWKNIDDRVNSQQTKLNGFYFQAGYLAHQSLHWWPQPLEIAARYAKFTPNTLQDYYLDELTLAFNWFFKGHRNKLTMEISEFDLETADVGIKDEFRFRIQWDISI
ncbi:OprO/OprP family phosphate-selective porin [Zunongwangia pacifica]|uniref:OprO/OprP family phosphate-selective porin n=1 Tax=Zunongwangia pacifica TaxID=2911062 RepID=A0A9X1ZR92_9FLAO|nr:porin [Zunongwangia pacifica]MCL6219547.1 OprO/OprP family phosphate-selective porin [Zunongwangia pacifica]